MLLKVINDWVDDTTEVSDLHITQKFSLTDIRKQSAGVSATVFTFYIYI